MCVCVRACVCTFSLGLFCLWVGFWFGGGFFFLGGGGWGFKKKKYTMSKAIILKHNNSDPQRSTE